MTPGRVRQYLSDRSARLDEWLRELFYRMPFQLCELFVAEESGEGFACRYCLLRRSLEDVHFAGPGHAASTLNRLDPSDTAAWAILQRLHETRAYVIDDVWVPNQLLFSVYRQALDNPPTNFRLLQSAYPDFFVLEANRQIYRLKDLTIVRIPEPDGAVAAVIRLFNHLRKPGEPIGALGLGYVDHLLFATSVEIFAEERSTDLDPLGTVTDSHGRQIPLRSRSARMKQVYRYVRAAARTTSSVLVEGERGTGKELIVKWIHQAGPRAAKPFVPIDCAISPGVLESELFGHERGAFTGATSKKQGLFVVAHGGTLFLDEIGEMPLDLQAKLLRALEERAVRPVGALQTVPVDIRVVAATNRDLADAMAGGSFREDLFDRLAVLRVQLPPLREHPEDIPELIDEILTGFASDGTRVPFFPPEVKAQLAARRWPGNVRELRNAVERMIGLYSDEESVPLAALLAAGGGWRASDAADAMRVVLAVARQFAGTEPFSEETVLDWVTHIAKATALDLHQGNKSATSRYLGCAEGSIYNHVGPIERLLRSLQGGIRS